MKVGFLTFEQYHGKKDIGSSRIRAKWLIDRWGGDHEAELFTMGEKYDVVVFQKVYWPEYAKQFDGVKILDICDPDWLHWAYRIKEMIDACDAVSCNTEETAKFIVQLTDKPVWVIPDRLDFSAINVKKDHRGNGETKKIVWYGYSDNFPMLHSACSVLVKGDFELIVISNEPFVAPPMFQEKLKIQNYPWNERHAHEDIIRGDVVINPRSNTGKYKYKSNNKTILSWALGMPVANNADELKLLMTEESRIAESERRFKEVKELYNVENSVWEMKKLISDCFISRNQGNVVSEMSFSERFLRRSP